MALAEVTVSVILGFISGASCGVITMWFWHKQQERKIESQ